MLKLKNGSRVAVAIDSVAHAALFSPTSAESNTWAQQLYPKTFFTLTFAFYVDHIRVRFNG